MRVLHKQGEDDVATAYLARFGGENKYVEFVDSLGGATSIQEKWVIIISSMFGCPVDCKFCDAGQFYGGPLSTDQMMQQVNHVVREHSPDRRITSDKFKVQFARIGEPSFNDDVLETIMKIRETYEPKTYMPCISTVAPAGREKWFDRLAELNRQVFKGNFQLQFSIHSTDEDYRDYLIPVNKMPLEQISEYGENFFCGGRKVALNFALNGRNPIDVQKLSTMFDKDCFAIKMTPLNPTLQAEKNDLVNVFSEEGWTEYPVVEEMKSEGFDVYLSIGDLRENQIKSNCGQVLLSYLDPKELEQMV